MEKETFKIVIDASRERVWDVLWTDANYREWTSAFTPDSHVETDWKKGSKVLFLDGKNNGMVSKIAENIPSEFMSFEHQGTVNKGMEQMNNPEDDAWRGAHEDYRLENLDGKTELTVELETRGMEKGMLEEFKSIWPKALENVKAIAERN